MPKPKPFVFNDGSKNSHGFIVPTEGISLTRFKKNPVMLDNHYPANSSVLGKWEDITAKNGVLSAMPVFDSEDESAAAIAGKVERGFISTCSMGLRFRSEDLKFVAGQLILEKCELYEVSIVPVPSNENSIRLYSAETGEPLEDSEVQKICLSALPVNAEEVIHNNSKPETNMKITLSSVILFALGFAAGTTEVDQTELEAKIKALHAEKNAAELKLSAKLEAEEAAKLTAITAKVDSGITAGNLSADKRDQYIQLGVVNETLLDDVLANAPKKASLAAQVTASGVKDAKVETVDDFQKLDSAAQLAFKQSRPEDYMKLFTKK